MAKLRTEPESSESQELVAIHTHFTLMEMTTSQIVLPSLTLSRTWLSE